jgi:hypothetical protein
LKDRASNRARLVGALAYAAMPVGMNAIGQGRVDVLLVVAGLPFIVRRIFEVMDVPGFRTRPYGEPVPFGHRGWRTTQAGQRMLLIMLVALITALAPATLLLAVLVILSVALSRLFEPDPSSTFRGTGRMLGSLVFNVAIFLLPMTVDTLLAGRQALEVFGLARGPWSVPSFSFLLRGADGNFGAAWWGWLLPLAAGFALVLCRGERRRVASKLAVIATLSLILATLASRHWLGSFTPDLDVILVLYAIALASLIGLGVGALEHDLREAGFGWRQVAAGLSIATLVVASLPFLQSLGSGRFDLPTSSVAESLNTLAPSTAGGYRVLWLGDPSVLPLAGWSVAPGLEAATSMNGLPGGSTLFSPPDAGASSVILQAVESAMTGHTVQLGSLLAPAGISTIVVMNSSSPEVSGVESSPLRHVPGMLMSALSSQSDLSLELQTASDEVFSNADFHGIYAETKSGSTVLTPVFSSTAASGLVTPGSTVVAGLAPASAFALSIDGQSVSRSTFGTWTPSFSVPSSAPATATAAIVMHRFPLNGILALFTLVVWILVWLGFGWVQRLEWLFTGRRRRAAPRRQRRRDE